MKLSDIPTGSVVFIDANVPLAVIFGERNALNGIQAMDSFDHDLERVDFIELYGQA